MFHNFAVLRLNRRVVESLAYSGDVVDLGCGTAPYAEYIESTGARYLGVDWEDSRHASNRVDLFADLTQRVPLDSRSADIVTAFQVLEHIPNPQDFLRECHRLLRPGGRLYLMTPFMWHLHEEPHDYFRYTRFGLARLIQDAGLAVESIRENTGFWQMWVLKLNYHIVRCTPRLVQVMMAPAMVLAQIVAPVMDGLLPDVTECASYTAVAVRPTARVANPSAAHGMRNGPDEAAT